MATMQEIETKTMGLLSIKKVRKGLSQEEEGSFAFLNKKYRDKRGHLINGSFYVGSDGHWKKV